MYYWYMFNVYSYLCDEVHVCHVIEDLTLSDLEDQNQYDRILPIIWNKKYQSYTYMYAIIQQAGLIWLQ